MFLFNHVKIPSLPFESGNCNEMLSLISPMADLQIHAVLAPRLISSHLVPIRKHLVFHRFLHRQPAVSFLI